MPLWQRWHYSTRQIGHVPAQPWWAQVIIGAQVLHCSSLQLPQTAATLLGRQSLHASVSQEAQDKPHLRQNLFAHDWQDRTGNLSLPHNPHGCFALVEVLPAAAELDAII